jgi:hypothetical protein
LRHSTTAHAIIAVLALCTAALPAAAADLQPGLVGEYFTYRTDGYIPTLPEGARPFLVRVDKQIDFPDPGTGGDFHKTKLVYNFAVRWTGVVRVDKAGEYTFFTQSDDGARLTIADKVVVENDGPHPLSEKSGKVQLTPGDHPIRLEFAQGGGGSAMMLLWQPPGGKKEIVPASALFHAQEAEKVAWDENAWKNFQLGGNRQNAAPRQDNTQWGRMDYGPFLSHTIGAPQPAGNMTLKGTAVKLDGGKAGVLFDTQNMRLSAAWTGGFVHLKGVAFDGGHGPNPENAGTFRFGTRPGPGWAKPGTNGNFNVPTTDPSAPLPKDWLRYKGLYRSGDKVIFSYTVGSTDVLEMPGIEGSGNETVFTRTFVMGPSRQQLTLAVADLDQHAVRENAPSNSIAMSTDTHTVALTINGGTRFATMHSTNELPPQTRLGLAIPAHDVPIRFVVSVWHGDKNAFKTPEAREALTRNRKPADLHTLLSGGPALWPQTVETRGKLGTPSTTEPNAAAYVVDTIEPPFQNPWNSWIRFGGFDFFPDGKSAALCTWSGDVWVVSGIDDKLEKLTWKRYAAGLFQPLGLKIVDGKVYVHGRDQITKLHDLNGDGEADFYESFNNDLMVTTGFHEFNFDLHTDPAGNFYFIKAGPVNPGGGGFGRITPHAGSLMRVSKDGGRLDVVATGFRAPNGMGVGPNGEMTSGDNQGTWTPVCRLNWIKPGGFFGVVDLAHRDTPPKQTENPLCWLPYAWDNSSGSQVWVTSDKWGNDFRGDLLHLSYGKCALFKVLVDKADGGDVQGGLVKFPLKFDSGVMRARVNPADGQVWVCGLRGWQTDAATDACFQRVRYTGKPVYMADAMKVRPNGIEITFTQPLDAEVANDAGSFGVEQWNYRWTSNYGSDEYSAKDPSKKGRDAVEVKSARLLPDGKTVFLEIEDFRPVMQMLIKYDLEAKDGTMMRDEIACTVNAVGDKKLVVSSGN